MSNNYWEEPRPEQISEETISIYVLNTFVYNECLWNKKNKIKIKLVYK